jgi:hypothetical protein
LRSRNVTVVWEISLLSSSMVEQQHASFEVMDEFSVDDTKVIKADA